MTDKQTCSGCKFYLPFEGDAGNCRRYPPTLIVTAWVTQPGAIQAPGASPLDVNKKPPIPVMGNDVTNTGGVFPSVSGTEGWCGEFAERPRALDS